METLTSILFGFANRYLLVLSFFLDDRKVSGDFVEVLLMIVVACFSFFELYCVWYYLADRSLVPHLSLNVTWK